MNPELVRCRASANWVQAGAQPRALQIRWTHSGPLLGDHGTQAHAVYQGLTCPPQPMEALSGPILQIRTLRTEEGANLFGRIWGSSQFCFQGSQGKPGVMGCPGSGPGVSRIPQPAVDEGWSVRLCKGPLPSEGDDKRVVLISVSFPSVGSPRA